MKTFTLDKTKLHFTLILFAVCCVFFVQCSGGSSSSSSSIEDEIEVDPSCTDIPSVKKFLSQKTLSMNAEEATDTTNVEVIVCVSEDDDDGDTIADSEDNCSTAWNFSQTDTDSDGIGDACDNCESVSNATQNDTDQDGTGDDCDADTDNDGVADTADNCETIYNPDQIDTDGDNTGDMCDGSDTIPTVTSDADGDGIADENDNCPNDDNAFVNEAGYDYTTDYQWDMDGDGIGDACDDDIDNDTRSNGVDNCDYNIRSDCGGTDTDGDGVPDSEDNCDTTVNPGQEDLDQDDIGSACDADESVVSEDVVVDEIEETETTPETEASEEDETPVASTEICNDNVDNDLDGDEDCDDSFCKEKPYCDFDGDGTKNSSDSDKDGDGLPNTLDLCAMDVDEWYIVPIHWLEDNNNLADDGIYFAECSDIDNIIYTGSAVCDLVEELSVVKLFVDGDYRFIEHNFTTNSELTDTQRGQAKNANDTFTYGNSEITLGKESGKSYYMLDTAYMIGTFQKDRDEDGIGDACDTGLVVKHSPNIDIIKNYTAPANFFPKGI